MRHTDNQFETKLAAHLYFRQHRHMKHGAADRTSGHASCQAGSHRRGITIEPNHRECTTRTHPLLPQESSIGLTNSDRYPPYLWLGARLVPNTFQLTTSIIKVALMSQLIFHTFTATSGTSNGAISVGLGLNPDPNTLP